MPRKRYSVEQIMSKLREAEVELSRGATTPEACRKIGVSTQTFYRWRKEYGGLKIDQAKRLRELERENARLKKLVDPTALLESALQRATLQTKAQSVLTLFILHSHCRSARQLLMLTPAFADQNGPQRNSNSSRMLSQ